MDLPISGVTSAKLKLARIAKHIDKINALIANLALDGGTYEIVKDVKGNDAINFIVDAPTDIQLIAGEIVYQFRSALDNLAFALVNSNPSGMVLPKDWNINCQFPILLDVPKYGNPPIPHSVPVPKSFFDKRLPGISVAAYAFIEGVQPYRREAGIQSTLRIIGTLANIDKHRHLYVLLPKAAVIYDYTWDDGTQAATSLGGLKHGAEVPWPSSSPTPTPMHMKRRFSPYITFDETIGVGPDTLAAEDVLHFCLKQFESVIIPAFEKLIQDR